MGRLKDILDADYVDGKKMVEYLILIISIEAVVELWKKAAPIQSFKEWLIINTPFLYSPRLDTHLMECPYCMSVWIGFIMSLCYFINHQFIYVAMILSFHRASNYIHIGISYLRDLQLNIRAGRKI